MTEKPPDTDGPAADPVSIPAGGELMPAMPPRRTERPWRSCLDSSVSYEKGVFRATAH